MAFYGDLMWFNWIIIAFHHHHHHHQQQQQQQEQQQQCQQRQQRWGEKTNFTENQGFFMDFPMKQIFSGHPMVPIHHQRPAPPGDQSAVRTWIHPGLRWWHKNHSWLSREKHKRCSFRIELSHGGIWPKICFPWWYFFKEPKETIMSVKHWHDTLDSYSNSTNPHKVPK